MKTLEDFLNSPLWISLVPALGAITGVIFAAYLPFWLMLLTLVSAIWSLLVLFDSRYFGGSWIVQFWVMLYYIPMWWGWVITTLIVFGGI